MRLTINSEDVSTIIPVGREVSFLGAAVRSVLQQSQGEIIVVDDNSGHDLRGLLGNFSKVRVVSNSRMPGPAGARNEGLERSERPIVAFIDADDVWAPGKMERQLACLDQDSDLRVVLGHLRFWHDPPRVVDDKSLLSYSFGAALFRREAFQSVGLISEELRFGEDTNWFLRAREAQLKMLVLNDVVLNYRKHAQNMTSERTTEQRGEHLFGAIRATLRRRTGRSLAPLQREKPSD